LHTREQTFQYFRDVVLKQCEVWVAPRQDANEAPLGFIAIRFTDSELTWVDHLYADPDFYGQQIGSRLLGKGKALSPWLQLWTFQRNMRACTFYEKHGFKLVRLTDGCGNEEKEPDALYEWTRQK
jgi:putative acetyltransferase